MLGSGRLVTGVRWSGMNYGCCLYWSLELARLYHGFNQERGRLINDRLWSRVQHVIHYAGQPIHSPVLILGFKCREDQFRKQVQIANVVVAEGIWKPGERLHNSKLHTLTAQRDDYSGTTSNLAREIQIHAYINIAIIAAEDAVGVKAILQ